MSNLKILKGDLFTSHAQTLVNTVNCVGVMGKGIAAVVKKKYPEVFREYFDLCQRGKIKLGEPYLHTQMFDKWILSFPTKDHWRSVSRIEDIEAGLAFLKSNYERWGITSMAVPPLGCGNGQLDWTLVGPTMARHLSEFDIPIELYAPFEVPNSQVTLDFVLSEEKSAKQSLFHHAAIDEARAASVAIAAVVSAMSKEAYAAPVGRTTLQKLVYFLTLSGVPTGMQFSRGNYGPFSNELKPQLSKLVNNGLLREQRHGKMFLVTPGPAYADARALAKPYLLNWLPSIERTVDLLTRLYSTTEVEIAASIQFVFGDLAAQRSTKLDENAVIDEVLRWKGHRIKGNAKETVAQLTRKLNLLDWVDLELDPEVPHEYA